MTCRYLLSVLLLSTGGTWAQSGERPPTHVPRVAEPERPANGGEVFTITLVEYGRGGVGVAKGTFERQLKALIGDPLVLGDQGQSWKKLRPSHPLCRSFYAFPNGAPRGGTPGGSREILETLEVQGRAAVIFSNMNISWYWGNEQVKRRERGLQFGTNLIVFAMRQQNPVQ